VCPPFCRAVAPAAIFLLLKQPYASQTFIVFQRPSCQAPILKTP
jgi:hypothetical protein